MNNLWISDMLSRPFTMSDRTKKLIALCFPLLWITLLVLVVGCCFETNDDRMLSEVFSGAMTGSPEPHGQYVNYLLGLFISTLFRITAKVQWYGLFLLSMHLLSHCMLLHTILKSCKTRRACVMGLFGYGLFLLLSVRIITNIQYTSTSALLCISGYLCLYITMLSDFELSCHTKAYFSVIGKFLILEVLGFCIRTDAMFMIQPIGMTILGALMLAHYKKILPCLRPVFTVLATVLAIIVLGRLCYLAAYHTEEWKTFETSHNARISLVDYYGIPDYENVASILEKYGVSENQYNAFKQYTIQENNLTGACLAEISEYAKASFQYPDASTVFHTLVKSYFNPEYSGAGILVLFLIGILVALVLISESYYLVFPLFCLEAVRTAIWAFLIYRGRTPYRVMCPLLIMEICILFYLICLSIKDLKVQNLSRGRLNAYITCLVILVLGSLLLGKTCFKGQLKYSITANVHEKTYSQGYNDLVAYCEAQPERGFYLDATAMLYYRGSALDATSMHPRNTVASGCWYSGTPVLFEHTKEYIASHDRMSIITSTAMAEQSESVIAYLEEFLGKKAVPAETISVSNGGTYLLYDFE